MGPGTLFHLEGRLGPGTLFHYEGRLGPGTLFHCERGWGPARFCLACLHQSRNVSGHVHVYVLDLSILPLSTLAWLEFRTVPTV